MAEPTGSATSSTEVIPAGHAAPSADEEGRRRHLELVSLGSRSQGSAFKLERYAFEPARQ
jgi:hypothetical protein